MAKAIEISASEFVKRASSEALLGNEPDLQRAWRASERIQRTLVIDDAFRFDIDIDLSRYDPTKPDAAIAKWVNREIYWQLKNQVPTSFRVHYEIDLNSIFHHNDDGLEELASRDFFEEISPPVEVDVDERAPVEKALGGLALAQEAVDASRMALTQAVAEARSAGATWSNIGTTLGITRQAAFNRFDPSGRKNNQRLAAKRRKQQPTHKE